MSEILSSGTLIRWNDDRGFGFIRIQGTETDLFVHHSAFPRDGRRPVVGEVLRFEIEDAGGGKQRAVRVRRAVDAVPRSVSVPPAAGVPRIAGSRQSARGAPVERPRRVSGWWWAAVVAGVGGWLVSRTEIQRSAPPAASVDAAPVGERVVRPAPALAAPAYRCDGRTRCPQMRSCEEATWFIQHCPGTQMDGDGDGVPCEREFCGGEH